MSIKIIEAPTTPPKGALKIPVGNVPDTEAHTITLSSLKDWLLSNDSGGLTWGDISGKPNIVLKGELVTVNGQSLIGGGNITLEAETIQWSKVINKPVIPTRTSDLINDLNFLTKQQADTLYNPILISGENIATINGYTLLNGGNIVIEGSEQIQSDWNQTDSSQVDFIKNKPSILPMPQVKLIEGEEGSAGVWAATIEKLMPNTYYICRNVTRVTVEDIDPSVGGSLPTRIYMIFPHDQQGNKETKLELTLSEEWPVLGELFTKRIFNQKPDFAPFCVEFLNGFVETIGYTELSN